MEKFRVDIVGLHHHDVRSHDREYAASAVGLQLVLQPQPENVKDPYAVRAREGRKHVGYVAVPDLDVVYQALAGSGLQRLRGVVVESNANPPVLTVEADVERIDWAYEPFDDTVYAGWHYDGLPLMPRRMEALGDLTSDLTDALAAPPSPDNAKSCAESALADVRQVPRRPRGLPARGVLQARAAPASRANCAYATEATPGNTGTPHSAPVPPLLRETSTGNKSDAHSLKNISKSGANVRLRLISVKRTAFRAGLFCSFRKCPYLCNVFFMVLDF